MYHVFSRFRVCSVRVPPKPFLLFTVSHVYYINVHKCSLVKIWLLWQIYKRAHHRGCAIPLGPRHTNPVRAEQVWTGLMVSALFITIYVELGAQPVGFTTWSGKSNNPKVARVWVIDMIWQLYLVFGDRLSQAVRSTPKYDEHSHFFLSLFSIPKVVHVYYINVVRKKMEKCTNMHTIGAAQSRSGRGISTRAGLNRYERAWWLALCSKQFTSS